MGNDDPIPAILDSIKKIADMIKSLDFSELESEVSIIEEMTGEADRIIEEQQKEIENLESDLSSEGYEKMGDTWYKKYIDEATNEAVKIIEEQGG